MLIPKKHRREVYEYVFREGVIVVKKDFNAPKHTVLDVPNLEVIKALQSLKSRGFVTEQFNWQWYYYYLTTEGIEYLREFLHLPPEIVPATLKKKALPQAPRTSRPDREDRPRREGGDRDGYRPRRFGGEGGEEKKTGAGGDFKPEFRGGFGRGGRQPQGDQ